MVGTRGGRGEAVGEYVTKATAAGAGLANYTVSYIAGEFTITPKAATVTAGSGTKEYGSSDPALTAVTATGFSAGDLAGPHPALSRPTSEQAGHYATTASAKYAGTCH